jgi:hypothetical protein
MTTPWKKGLVGSLVSLERLGCQANLESSSRFLEIFHFLNADELLQEELL